MKYSSNSNPFLSRRTYNCLCKWWARSTFNGQLNLSKIAMANEPKGTFRAKAIAQYSMDKKNEAEIRLSSNFVTIETPDNLQFMRVDDIVQFENIFYRVSGIQRREIVKTREFMKRPISVYVLQLYR